MFANIVNNFEVNVYCACDSCARTRQHFETCYHGTFPDAFKCVLHRVADWKQSKHPVRITIVGPNTKKEYTVNV